MRSDFHGDSESPVVAADILACRRAVASSPEERAILPRREPLKISVPSKSFLSLIQWSRKIPRLLNYGPPYPDVMTRNFVEQLGEKGEITRAQMRILNIYKMISFESNGACSIISPSSKDFTKAKTMIGILLMLIPLLVMVVWEVSNCIYPGLPFGFLMGATLGLIWRDIYNFAWGREKLAIYISSKYLWLRRA